MSPLVTQTQTVQRPQTELQASSRRALKEAIVVQDAAVDAERRARARMVAAGGRRTAPQDTIDAWVAASEAKFTARLAVLRRRSAVVVASRRRRT